MLRFKRAEIDPVTGDAHLINVDSDTGTEVRRTIPAAILAELLKAVANSPAGMLALGAVKPAETFAIRAIPHWETSPASLSLEFGYDGGRQVSFLLPADDRLSDAQVEQIGREASLALTRLAGPLN
jgi:hypothetical protein